MEEVEAEEEDLRGEGPQVILNLPINPAEEEVMEVSEENPEVESLTKVPPRGFPEKTPRQKMQTKTDAGTAVKLVIG